MNVQELQVEMAEAAHWMEPSAQRYSNTKRLDLQQIADMAKTLISKEINKFGLSKPREPTLFSGEVSIEPVLYSSKRRAAVFTQICAELADEKAQDSHLPMLSFHSAPHPDTLSKIIRNGFLCPGDLDPETGEPLQTAHGAAFGHGVYSSTSLAFSAHFGFSDQTRQSVFLVNLVAMGRCRFPEVADPRKPPRRRAVPVGRRFQDWQEGTEWDSFVLPQGEVVVSADKRAVLPLLRVTVDTNFSYDLRGVVGSANWFIRMQEQKEREKDRKREKEEAEANEERVLYFHVCLDYHIATPLSALVAARTGKKRPPLSVVHLWCEPVWLKKDVILQREATAFLSGLREEGGKVVRLPFGDASSPSVFQWDSFLQHLADSELKDADGSLYVVYLLCPKMKGGREGYPKFDVNKQIEDLQLQTKYIRVVYKILFFDSEEDGPSFVSAERAETASKVAGRGKGRFGRGQEEAAASAAAKVSERSAALGEFSSLSVLEKSVLDIKRHLQTVPAAETAWFFRLTPETLTETFGNLREELRTLEEQVRSWREWKTPRPEGMNECGFVKRLWEPPQWDARVCSDSSLHQGGGSAVRVDGQLSLVVYDSHAWRAIRQKLQEMEEQQHQQKVGTGGEKFRMSPERRKALDDEAVGLMIRAQMSGFQHVLALLSDLRLWCGGDFHRIVSFGPLVFQLGGSVQGAIARLLSRHSEAVGRESEDRRHPDVIQKERSEGNYPEELPQDVVRSCRQISAKLQKIVSDLKTLSAVAARTGRGRAVSRWFQRMLQLRFMKAAVRRGATVAEGADRDEALEILGDDCLLNLPLRGMPLSLLPTDASVAEPWNVVVLSTSFKKEIKLPEVFVANEYPEAEGMEASEEGGGGKKKKSGGMGNNADLLPFEDSISTLVRDCERGIPPEGEGENEKEKRRLETLVRAFYSYTFTRSVFCFQWAQPAALCVCTWVSAVEALFLGLKARKGKPPPCGESVEQQAARDAQLLCFCLEMARRVRNICDAHWGFFQPFLSSLVHALEPLDESTGEGERRDPSELLSTKNGCLSMVIPLACLLWQSDVIFRLGPDGKAKSSPVLSRFAFALLGEAIQRACKAHLKSTGKTKGEALRETLQVDIRTFGKDLEKEQHPLVGAEGERQRQREIPETFEDWERDGLVGLVDINKATIHTGKVFLKKRYTNCSAFAVVAVFGFVRLLREFENRRGRLNSDVPLSLPVRDVSSFCPSSSSSSSHQPPATQTPSGDREVSAGSVGSEWEKVHPAAFPQQSLGGLEIKEGGEEEDVDFEFPPRLPSPRGPRRRSSLTLGVPREESLSVSSLDPVAVGELLRSFTDSVSMKGFLVDHLPQEQERGRTVQVALYLEAVEGRGGAVWGAKGDFDPRQILASHVRKQLDEAKASASQLRFGFELGEFSHVFSI
uniref:PARP catalytic domain-containing protein n=1 Tax=Chromera velia CCMP2878 TaxID=1169474 RepID=A0A0G4G1U9_9ALVE|eukprot:Cvel_19759.t1-p1 / transcript=Cvel_19759.t1 / gene=Cvel_19759 / organism=Chromera_velia_CCMP2878 / gene_product=hypothetical protein / transcript_product=hypothetical protein / location=Cvel_scaffold1730:27408-34543(-) / protein_length=1410 / sequence_SO=supercontig / SO=protein_coding / is_pseudo=false